MLVSICIPTYGQAEKFKRLLDSIITQDYKDYEIIVTDDTRDNSIKNIVGEYSKKIYITYIKNDRILGATDNCNKAIKNANGNLIKVMHQDDWFSFSNSLSIMVKKMTENNSCHIFFTGTYQVSSEYKKERAISEKHLKKIKKDYRFLFVGNFLGAPSAAIFYNEGYFFDSKLKWLVDMELYMRILEKHNDVEAIEKPLISIGESDSQLTNKCKNDWNLQLREYAYIFKKHKLYKKPIYVLYMIRVFILVLLNKIGFNRSI